MKFETPKSIERSGKLFWGQFSASIHSNDSITDVDRFAYLKRYLSGDAQATISGLTLSSDNYREAINLLIDRYGNPQVQISAHMESLLKIKKVKSMENVEILRKLYNEVESCVRNLKSLKVETNTYGSLLIPLLNERLPEELRVLISRKFGNNMWTLNDMLVYFNEELQAKERCATFSKSVELRDNPSPNPQHPKNPFTASNLLNQAEDDDNKRCAYCRNNHPPSKCEVVSSVMSRVAILRRHGKCFLCLKSGHRIRDCTSKYKCRRCEERHHISICRSKKEVNVESFINHNSSTCNILLQTAKARVGSISNKMSMTSRILFDSGSQRSYISKELRLKLQLPARRKERILIKTFGNMDSTLQELDVVQLKIDNRFDDSFVYVEALTVPFICSPLTNQNLEFPHTQFHHLSDLVLADHGYNDVDSDVHLLIGLDFYYSFISGKVLRGDAGPVALESSLGWILAGCAGSSGKNSSHCFETHIMHFEGKALGEDVDIREELNKFWKVESVGESEDKCVVYDFENDLFHNGERYVASLPFRPDHELIPDNYTICKKRLDSLKRRFDADPKLYTQYNAIFEDYETELIIERVPANEVAKKPGTVCYLPHHPVIRNDKDTTKVRAVFDASCSINKPSLNDCLYTGPNLLPNIFNILLRFRMNHIGIIADIKQAFLNIEISRKHIDFLRFLWLDADSGEEIVFRFLRVVFGVNCSPFLLNGTIRHHLKLYEQNDPDFLEKLSEDLYVDDVTSGCKDIEEGYEFYKKAKFVMSEAGFNLRKWVSNNAELQQRISCDENANDELSATQDDTSYSKSLFPDDAANVNKVLGLEWDLQNDEIVFRFDEFVKKASELQPTKRNILRLSASIYDPLGLVSPITTKVKILFQMLCRDKYGWDDEVSNEIAKVWKKLVSELNEIQSIRVTRYIFYEVNHDILSVQIHGFSDSSQQAYAAAVYVRIVTKVGVRVHLMSAKSKVAPIKKLSIPRLELLGCLLLTKLMKEIKGAIFSRFVVDDVFGWCDSKVALCWIRGKSKWWKPWVENRAVSIRDVIKEDRWKYVPGPDNSADMSTRIGNVKMLSDSTWYQGPSFLWDEDVELRDFDLNDDLDVNSVLMESRKKDDVVDEIKGYVDSSKIPEEEAGEVSNLLASSQKEGCRIGNIIDIKIYGSLEKLIMVTGYVMRFIKNLLLKRKKKDDEVITDEVLTMAEYDEAHHMWIKDAQYLARAQSNYKTVAKSLNMFEDDSGIQRLRGRFGNSNLDYNEKHPIFLSWDGYLTKLTILQAHENVWHHGIESTLNNVRSMFWITKGRKTVKNILRKCVVCKRFQGKCLKPPVPPELPEFRVNESCNSFQATGLDFAGPLYIKDPQNNGASKVYILLFTCATTRAIHLELTPDMKVPAFIRGIKRFTTRRGTPDLIVHDNFTTFKAKEVKRYLLSHGMSQRFILPASPWWGGFYERLVRSVKISLKKVLGRALLTFEELQTVLCEVEEVINARPLVYVSEDDLMETITPFHLMFGRDISKPKRKMDDVSKEINDANVSSCSKRVNYLRKLIGHYFKRFQTTYFSELRQQHSYRNKKNAVEERCLIVGDVVLIKDDGSIPRSMWKMGRVDELIIGRDGKVRGAKLQVTSGTGKQSKISRPVQRLIPFEISNEVQNQDADDVNESSINNDEKNEADTTVGEKETIVNSRPKRKAARDGEAVRRLREQFS